MGFRRMLRKLTWMLFSSVLLSCSDRPADAGRHTLIIAVENDIQTLDPSTLSDPYTSRIVWQMYEGLLGLDDQGRAMPLLAESWYSNNQFKTWTVKLRPHVYYHPSAAFKNANHTRTVNAWDVQYSFTRFARAFGSFVFNGVVDGFKEFVTHQAGAVKGFVVKDSLTIQFQLTQSEPTFIYRLTSPYLSIMPREAIETEPHAFGRSVCVGSGPFMLCRRTATEVTLSRFPDYWRKTTGNLDEISFRVEKNPQLRITQFENRIYDLMQAPTAFLPRFLQGDSLRPELQKRFRLFTQTTFNIHYLGLNCLDLPDVHLRRAIAFGINKNGIVHSLLFGQAQIATSPVVPGMQGYDPPQGLVWNPDSARRELAASSYHGGPITLLVSDAPNSEQLGQIIQSDLAQIGINVALQKLDFNSLIARIFSGDKPDLFILFSEWIFGAPEFIIDSYNSQKRPNPNLFGYRNATVDQRLEGWRHTEQRSDINRICREAESVALAEAPAVWLFHMRNIYLANNRLLQFSVSANQYWNLADAVWQE